MADEYLPPVEFLRECFSYDPETGTFHWRVRPESHCGAQSIARAWNSRLAGSQAFTGVDKDGYGRAEFVHNGRRLRLRSHRVAFKLLTNEEPEFVDHISGNTRDDSAGNLRAATVLTNSRNRIGPRKHPLPKGVSREKGRFRAQGHLNGRKVSLGSFDTPAEAHAAFCAWAKPIHGEFFNPGPAKPSVFD